MITGRNLTVSVFCALLWTPLMYAQDLSRYRKFQFGMNLPAVAKKADVKLSEARVVRQGPATIQELEWWPQHSPTASPQADSVKEALFTRTETDPVDLHSAVRLRSEKMEWVPEVL
jgi:hypothetical protein